MDPNGRGDARVAAGASGNRRWAHEAHAVQLYEDDAHLVRTTVQFLGRHMDAGGTSVVVGEPDHRHAVADGLRSRGVDLARAESEGRYVALDAAETLRGILVDGKPAPGRLESALTPAFSHTQAGKTTRPRVRVFGEMVHLLWKSGRHEAALELELQWNELLERRRIRLLCGYSLGAFPGADDARWLAEICAAHGAVMPSEAYSGLRSARDRLRFVAEIEQRSRALERESARCRSLEDALTRRDVELAEHIETTPDGILDVDPDGRVRAANPAAATLVGAEPATFVGRSLSETMLPKGFCDRVWSLLTSGRAVRDLDFWARLTPEGPRRSLRLEAATLRLAGRHLHMRWRLRAAGRSNRRADPLCEPAA